MSRSKIQCLLSILISKYYDFIISKLTSCSRHIRKCIRVFGQHTLYKYKKIYFKVIGVNSSILLKICNNLIPLEVVLYVFCPSSYSNRSFSINTIKYSFNCPKDKNALYIIFDFVAAPPLAASKIKWTMSVLLLYFILWRLVKV